VQFSSWLPMIWFGHSSHSRDGHGLVPESARVVGLLSWKSGAAGNVEARPAYLGPEYHFLNDLRCSEDEVLSPRCLFMAAKDVGFYGRDSDRLTVPGLLELGPCFFKRRPSLWGPTQARQTELTATPR
jgi:hypothetical protein